MRTLARTVPLLALLITLAATTEGCFPGNEGWSCDSDKECKAGLVCKEFGRVFASKYCVSPGTRSIRSSSTYGWIKLSLVWGVLGIIGLIAVVVAGIVAWEGIKSGLDRIRRR
jgi:hypothetical protein